MTLLTNNHNIFIQLWYKNGIKLNIRTEKNELFTHLGNWRQMSFVVHHNNTWGNFFLLCMLVATVGAIVQQHESNLEVSFCINWLFCFMKYRGLLIKKNALDLVSPSRKKSKKLVVSVAVEAGEKVYFWAFFLVWVIFPSVGYVRRR